MNKTYFSIGYFISKKDLKKQHITCRKVKLLQTSLSKSKCLGIGMRSYNSRKLFQVKHLRMCSKLSKYISKANLILREKS